MFSLKTIRKDKMTKSKTLTNSKKTKKKEKFPNTAPLQKLTMIH